MFLNLPMLHFSDILIYSKFSMYDVHVYLSAIFPFMVIVG